MSTDLVIGSTTNAGQIGAGFSGNSRNEKFTVYIDFNRNGSFADPGEALLSSTINGSNIRSFNISIPGTVTPGATRMRVVMRRNPGTVTSCITAYNGEAEDYNVNLIGSGNRFVSGEQLYTNSDKIIPEATRVTASPNPSAGLFNIAVPKNFIPLKYEVVNISGNIVARKNLNEKSIFTIDLSNASKGIYLLRMFDKQGGMQTTKLVVQ
jgi:hypothetical protein